MDDHGLVALWKFHYQRLKNAEGCNDDHEEHYLTNQTPRRSKSWRPWRIFMGKKRFRVRVLGSRKLSMKKIRRKSRVFKGMKVSWEKAFKRLKDNHKVYLNDLFGSNYLFMHVINP